jgi:hypothetical protein
VAATGPPAYAWDWFSRQRLLWREARSRLAADASPVAQRYAAVADRGEVLALLRVDYPRDDTVRATVDAVVREVTFLGRTEVPFARLAIRTPPRGLRWWWTALTGEDLDGAAAAPPAPAARQLALLELADLDPQPALDDVAEGYGG